MAAKLDLAHTRKMLFSLLKPDTKFFGAAVVYGLAISLLTLAVPLAVQTLINSVINTAAVRAIVTLAIVLFVILLVSVTFSALRMRVMEYYERRVFTRLTSELSLKTLFAPHSFFEGRRNTTIVQRYFDIMILQKNLPALMIDGFALVLQMLVGFTLVAFYHPALFVFNACILLAMAGVWKIWGAKAKATAIELSQQKYDTAKWLTDVAAAHEFFKSSRHLEHAAQETHQHIEHYLRAHRSHFRYTFTQSIMFLLIYALASALLLGLGGYLVVVGQLSIGQLVAAELIMSAVFIGISRFSMYLKLYYELYGAAEKLGTALAIPQETSEQSNLPIPRAPVLAFEHVTLCHKNRSCKLKLTIPAGTKCYVYNDKGWLQRQIIGLLKRYGQPNQGLVTLGGQSVFDYDPLELRQAVALVDRALIVECTIKQYLEMAATRATLAQIHQALESVNLLPVISALPKGLDTRLSAVGNPLQPLEFLLLKLAAAILSDAPVIVINQHFDTIPTGTRKNLLDCIEKLSATVLYFTNFPETNYFDALITLEDEAVMTALKQQGPDYAK